VVAVKWIVRESGALVRGILPVGGFIVCVAECSGWEGALTYAAESAVACGGSMVGSAVGAGEFGGGGMVVGLRRGCRWA
jgi:hypothetical protein